MTAGLFETMLVAGGRVVQLDEHRRRMRASCAALGYPVVDAEAFAHAVETAVETAPDGAVRCTWRPEDGLWRLEAVSFPIPETTLLRRERGRAVTLDRSGGWTLTRALPQHKLLPYDVCIAGLRHAVAMGADEGLFTDAEGNVLEGTATNVFAVSGRTLITAPAGVLPGVVRDWVVAQPDFTIEERPPTHAELRRGGFLTSSLTLIAPLRVLDGEPCAISDAALELAQRYERAFRIVRPFPA
jgi:branched-subunit amino acid aminotransferase/4-amino-4-deoxychorismate lyase